MELYIYVYNKRELSQSLTNFPETLKWAHLYSQKRVVA